MRLAMNRNTGLLTVILGLIVFCGLLAAVRPLSALPRSTQEAIAHTLRR
jgi:hypothetical protein